MPFFRHTAFALSRLSASLALPCLTAAFVSKTVMRPLLCIVALSSQTAEFLSGEQLVAASWRQDVAEVVMIAIGFVAETDF